MEPGAWNWLEVGKLVAGLLTPAALAAGGVYIHRVTKKFEHAQWRSQKLIEKRLAVYDDIAPALNDVLCYFTYVGGWRDFNPPAMISLKRVIDKKIYLAAPLFGTEFFSACMDFQNLCFETFIEWGQDARLRTRFIRRREARRSDWRPEWDANFSSNAPDPKEIRIAYQRVMKAFAEDIGVHSSFVISPSGHLSSNIK